MSVPVNSILNAGLITHGKLPDLYWEMNLTGTEIKVLRYVYNHCLRLYKNLKIFPRGKDGSPRFWRGKERMADDCNMSYPTFRKNVRHLFELGLVTSMDDEAEGVYCIGLSSVFLDSFISTNQPVKSFRLHNLKDLVVFLYDSTTVELLEKTIEKFPSITNVIEPDGTQGSWEISGSEENSQSGNDTKIVDNFKRTPIKVGRVPIVVLPETLRKQSAKKRLELMKNLRTPYERKILKIAEYYEYKCRQAIHSTGFRALGKDFRNHKNWKYLEKIHELCQENNWDYKVYLDSQFDRTKYWEHKQAYPYLNQCFSQNAIKCYQNYIKDYKEKTTITGDAKVKAGKVKSVSQQIIDEVIKDCERMSEYLGKAAKRRANKDLTPEQLKMVYLSDHWMGMSVSYLSSIPWFSQYLDQFPDEEYIVDLKSEIQAVKANRKLLSTTIEIVEKVEKQMEIPETMCL